MDINFAKKDFWLTIAAGEATAWLLLPTLKNLKFFDILAGKNISAAGFLTFWILFVPISALLALGVFYFFAKRKNSVGFFELGKYGVVGVLNTFLNAGIFNLLIFITNISVGFIVDLFFAAAFTAAVVNSFFWNKYWSFNKKTAGNIKTEAIQFFGVSTTVAVVNAFILHIIVNVIGAPPAVDPKLWANMALILTIVIAFFGNFFGYKFIVFKK